jgi:pre-mRNA-splicing factor ISY1
MVAQAAHVYDYRIRDLNDEINKLIREKGHWERRIVELGGPDYSRAAPKVTDSKGQEVAELTGVYIPQGVQAAVLMYCS